MSQLSFRNPFNEPVIITKAVLQTGYYSEIRFGIRLSFQNPIFNTKTTKSQVLDKGTVWKSRNVPINQNKYECLPEYKFITDSK